MVAFQDRAPGPAAALDLLWLHGLCPWVLWPCGEEEMAGGRVLGDGCSFSPCCLDTPWLSAGFWRLWGHWARQEPQHPAPVILVAAWSLVLRGGFSIPVDAWLTPAPHRPAS